MSSQVWVNMLRVIASEPPWIWDDVNCNYVEHASILNTSGGEIRSDYVYDDNLVSQRSRSQRETPCLILWEGGQRARALVMLSVDRDFCTFSLFFLMYTLENLQIYLLFTFPFRVTPHLDRCCSRLLGLQLKTKSTSTHYCLPGLSSESFCWYSRPPTSSPFHIRVPSGTRTSQMPKRRHLSSFVASQVRQHQP